MFKILNKKELNPTVTLMDIEAPLIAKKAKPGQFIILRVDDDGERIPLTIAGVNLDKGSVQIIFQLVGATTKLLNNKKVGESIKDFVGPLGKPTELKGVKNVCVVAGGVGTAIALPIARQLHKDNTKVTSIIGFRNKDLVILENEFNDVSDEFIIVSDDGSYKRKGNVTLPLKELLENNRTFDAIFVIGPLIMMKFVVETVRPYNIPVTVSMNPIMIDGTGMCGCCRLSLVKNNERVVKFACVDGPDFNGYEVDFDEAISRSKIYSDFEKKQNEHVCNLFKKEIQ